MKMFLKQKSPSALHLRIRAYGITAVNTIPLFFGQLLPSALLLACLLTSLLLATFLVTCLLPTLLLLACLATLLLATVALLRHGSGAGRFLIDLAGTGVFAV